MGVLGQRKSACLAPLNDYPNDKEPSQSKKDAETAGLFNSGQNYVMRYNG